MTLMAKTMISILTLMMNVFVKTYLRVLRCQTYGSRLREEGPKIKIWIIIRKCRLFRNILFVPEVNNQDFHNSIRSNINSRRKIEILKKSNIIKRKFKKNRNVRKGQAARIKNSKLHIFLLSTNLQIK